MEKEVYGFRFYFEQGSNRRFWLMEEAGVHRDMLAKHSLHMLEANRIPHLLPVHIEERDLLVKIAYNIEHKRSLGELLKSRMLGDYELLHFLDQLMYPFVEARNYMLTEQCFLLHQDFIFIDGEDQLVYLTYIPLKTTPNEYSSCAELYGIFKEVLLRLHVKEAANTLLTVLEEFYRTQDWQAVRQIRLELRRVIREQYADLSSKVVPAPNRSNLKVTEPSTEIKWIHALDVDLPLLSKNQVQKEEEARLGTTLETGELPPADPTAKLAPLSSRSATFLYLGAVLLIAVIWKLYLDYPIAGMVYVSAALSFVILNIAIILHKFWRPKFWSGKGQTNNPSFTPTHSDNSERKSNKELVSSRGLAGKLKRNVDNDDDKSGRKQQEKTSSPANHKEKIQEVKLNAEVLHEKSAEHYYAQLPKHTQLLAPKQGIMETVLLPSMNQQNTGEEEQDADGEGTCVEAYLVHTATETIVRLDQTPYPIGRDAKLARLVEEQPGVSRMHCEIHRLGSSFTIKDVGSRNGTFIKGEKLEEGKLYPLMHEDSLQLANVEFKFRIKQKNDAGSERTDKE